MIRTSERIRTLRKQAGLSQKELADLVGIAQNTLSQYESGTRALRVETLKKLSEVFGCSMESLAGVQKERACSDCPYMKGVQRLIEILGGDEDALERLITTAEIHPRPQIYREAPAQRGARDPETMRGNT